MHLPGNKYTLALAWALLTLILGALSLQQWRAGIPLDADLFSLLPTEERDPLVQRATQAAERALNRTTLVWVSSAREEQLTADVERIAERLRASELFSNVLTRANSQSSGSLNTLLPWRFHLLSPAAVAQLQSGNGSQAFVDGYLQRLTSPLSFAPISPQQDLFGLLNQWLQTLPVSGPTVDARNGLWTAEIEGRKGAFIILFNQADAFTLEVPEHIARLIQQISEDEARRDVRLLASGAALFAASAAAQAKAEISTVGLGSAAASMLVILWVFRSPRGWLTLLPVGYGSWVALLACDLLFGRVHLMTLVFGASLTGVSIDYALHVMADAFRSSGQWSAGKAVRKLLPGLTLGMATSVAAYACLGLAPFPGLQQVAVFSGVSLFAAYLLVIMTFPLLLTGFQRKHQPLLLSLQGRLLQLRERLLPRRAILFSIMAMIAITGIFRLAPDDNIRQLYASDARLQHTDEQLRHAFGLNYNSQFILIRGNDETQLLSREQQVLQRLERLKSNNQLESYSALSQWLPDQVTQQAHLALLGKYLFDGGAPVKDQLLDMGFNEDAIAREWQDFSSHRNHLLSVDAALALPVAAPWRSLWLGKDDNGVASRISVSGVKDIQALALAIRGIDGVQMVDRVGDISRLLGQYRSYTSYLIAMALVMTCLLLIPRYGAARSVNVVAAPALAILLTVGLHGYLQLNFNVFSLFGFLVVLGMGVDYAIYFEEVQHHTEADDQALQNTALGITLDVLTTLFSFGLLSVSTTPAVSAFGTSVLLGITFSWLFAHLVGHSVATARPIPASRGVLQ